MYGRKRANKNRCSKKSMTFQIEIIKVTFHLTISMRAQRATGKLQRTNYHHGSCGASLTSKT